MIVCMKRHKHAYSIATAIISTGETKQIMMKLSIIYVFAEERYDKLQVKVDHLT